MYNDLWEYDPATDSWLQKTDFPGVERYVASGFSLGDKGFIGTGKTTGTILLKDFYQYDAVNNSWTQQPDFPGTPRFSAEGFSLLQFGYIGTGLDNAGSYNNDFWAYNQFTETWSVAAAMPGTSRKGPASFTINDKAYLGTGIDTTNTRLNDWWEYSSMVGMNEYDDTDILSVSPVPVTDFCVFSSSQIIFSLELFDMQGNTVKSIKTKDKQVEVSLKNKAKGVYIYRLLIGSVYKFGKIVVN